RWSVYLFEQTTTWKREARLELYHTDLTHLHYHCRPESSVSANAYSRLPYHLATQAADTVMAGHYWNNRNREARAAKKLRRFHPAKQIVREHSRSHWRS